MEGKRCIVVRRNTLYTEYRETRGREVYSSSLSQYLLGERRRTGVEKRRGKTTLGKDPATLPYRYIGYTQNRVNIGGVDRGHYNGE